MRTLLYTKGSAVSDALREWARKQEFTVRWRNGSHFSEPERRAGVVYTDDPDIREAYEEQDVEVRDMPRPGKKNEATGRRYVPKDEGQWKKVYDRKTGEYVEGASKRSMKEARKTADKLNNS